ncbi:hypothetical protein Xbed_03480 [Xenorhabdus beddingii]|uniref:Uncharacterized protein n=1 Tax=Xenorhabdus beddingii TaxID=40578 RepID=A0A1Y2SFK9_9GAMM|nr:hypothetical protein Xbed_03480 [Xenorhabdus beddingii]
MIVLIMMMLYQEFQQRRDDHQKVNLKALQAFSETNRVFHCRVVENDQLATGQQYTQCFRHGIDKTDAGFQCGH